MHPASAPSIDRFIDALWLEDGLSPNTLAAYRRDLSLFAVWLGEQGAALDATTEHQLLQYFGVRHATTRATSANRRLTVFKRYFRWALREHIVIATDPTLKLLTARQALRVPKTLTEAQVEALLAAPDTTTPLGQRDRAMLELMYASGLRVSELVTLQHCSTSACRKGVLRVLGKGNKERLVPFGEIAREWLLRYLAEARPALLGRRQTEALFVTSQRHQCRHRNVAGDVLEHGQEIRAPGGALRRTCRPTRCAMPSPRTCSTMAPTCARSRCCWAMPTFRPPRSTPTWRASGSKPCTRQHHPRG
jgi:integrase/recombinase XerD